MADEEGTICSSPKTKVAYLVKSGGTTLNGGDATVEPALYIANADGAGTPTKISLTKPAPAGPRFVAGGARLVLTLDGNPSSFPVSGGPSVDTAKAYRRRKSESPPLVAYRALVGWLESKGHLAPCDVETLASTILGALHGWAFTARVCGESTAAAAGERYVERFVELLWGGIGGARTRSR